MISGHFFYLILGSGGTVSLTTNLVEKIGSGGTVSFFILSVVKEGSGGTVSFLPFKLKVVTALPAGTVLSFWQAYTLTITTVNNK
jgi:hypothetical protein